MNTGDTKPFAITAALVVVVTAVAMLGAPRPVHGFAYTFDELKCRDKLARTGVKLARAAAKSFTQCHAKRAKGSEPATTDCNSLSSGDLKGKVDRTADKLAGVANDRCAGFTPSFLGYESCPSPCDASINDFDDVAACIICLVGENVAAMTATSQGNPAVPMGSTDRKCHRTIGKRQADHLTTLLKDRQRCQKSAERAGETDTQGCQDADPRGKIFSTRQKGEIKIASDCAGANLAAIDSCSQAGVQSLAQCVFNSSESRGKTIFRSFYSLGVTAATTTTTTLPGGTTTSTTSTTVIVGTTTTTTTTTTLIVQDPQCPAFGELVLYASVGGPCSTNTDCPVGTCDTGLGSCVTVSDLDTGWTGTSHDSDVADQVVTSAELFCPGPFDGGSSEPCGECTVIGVDPSPGSCRCNNNNRIICNDPFALDTGDCSIGGGSCTTNVDCRRCDGTPSISCQNNDDCPAGELCMSGLRQPTCSGGQCVGTCNCYLGPPLPLSAGNTPVCAVNRIRNDITGTVNVDTGSYEATLDLATVVMLGESISIPCPYCTGDTTPRDGVRDGTCVAGENAGKSCDADGVNTTFPAPGGDGHSLDCFPTGGKNISGAGLRVDLRPTTGTTDPLVADIPCFFNTSMCHCLACSGDTRIACDSNQVCADAGAGTCSAQQGSARINTCDDGDCTDLGDGEGVCATGPDDTFCDGVTRANGEGFVACTSNADCANTDCGPGVSCGDCTLSKRRKCFPATIQTTGVADPQAAVTVTNFCIPQTVNTGVNNTAGLPGPGKVVNQTTGRAFCASNPAVEYEPGVGNCPP